MTGFELQTTGVGSDRSTNWATTTALFRDKKTLQAESTNVSKESILANVNFRFGNNFGIIFT